jgi:putative addiction module component (TIGR02574 family)
MNARVKQILDAAQELSVKERAQVAQGLLNSLDEDFEAPPAEDVARAWAAEIARRVTELDEGRVKGIPAAEVLERAREALTEEVKRRAEAALRGEGETLDAAEHLARLQARFR